MLRTELYMATNDHRLDGSFNTIVRVISVDNNCADVFDGNYYFTVGKDNLLPIGNPEIREHYGLDPFESVWPDNTARSGITPELAIMRVKPVPAADLPAGATIQ